MVFGDVSFRPKQRPLHVYVVKCFKDQLALGFNIFRINQVQGQQRRSFRRAAKNETDDELAKDVDVRIRTVLFVRRVDEYVSVGIGNDE